MKVLINLACVCAIQLLVPDLVAIADGVKEPTRYLKWYAPFLAESGFGSEATAFIQALDAVQPRTPTIVQAVQFAEPATFLPTSEVLSRSFRYASLGNPKDACVIVVCHSTPNFWVPSEFPSWDYAAPCPPRDATLRIGRAMYETDSVPRSWIARLNRMDRIWVPTRFAYEVFLRSGVHEEKLEIVPEPVDVSFYDKRKCPERTSSKFTYLAIFKWEERKGWKELFMSYLEAFPQETENVRLLIKTSEFHLARGETPRSIAELQFPILKTRQDVIFIEHRISDYELYRACYCEADALLSPSYGEGWGRVQAEAAAMEIPVLFTNFSGPTEFLNQQNAFPIMVDRMAPVTADADHHWAIPSVQDLVRLMHYVRDNPMRAQQIGLASRATMEERYSLNAIGTFVWELLQDACLTSKGSSDNQNSEL